MARQDVVGNQKLIGQKIILMDVHDIKNRLRRNSRMKIEMSFIS